MMWKRVKLRKPKWAKTTHVCLQCNGQDVVPKIKSYKEAIVAFEDIVLFLQHKGKT